jgi:hypothetical protein
MDRRKPRLESRCRSISASELAQMGVCERLVVFEHLAGRQRTLQQAQAMRRGQRLHRQFYAERQFDSDHRSRGFVAAPAHSEGLAVIAVKLFRARARWRYWWKTVVHRAVWWARRSLIGRPIAQRVIRALFNATTRRALALAMHAEKKDVD